MYESKSIHHLFLGGMASVLMYHTQDIIAFIFGAVKDTAPMFQPYYGATKKLTQQNSPTCFFLFRIHFEQLKYNTLQYKGALLA